MRCVNVTGGMVEFRRSLAASFLFRFFIHVASQLEADLPGFKPMFPDSYKSAAVPFHRPPVQGLQYYSKVPGEAVVGQPTRHMAADLQVIPCLTYLQTKVTQLIEHKLMCQGHGCLAYSAYGRQFLHVVICGLLSQLCSRRGSCRLCLNVTMRNDARLLF